MRHTGRVIIAKIANLNTGEQSAMHHGAASGWGKMSNKAHAQQLAVSAGAACYSQLWQSAYGLQGVADKRMQII